MTLSEEGQIRKAQVDVLVQICGAIEKLSAELVAVEKKLDDIATVIADVPVKDLMA